MFGIYFGRLYVVKLPARANTSGFRSRKLQWELHILVKNRRYQSHMFGISWRKKWGKEEFHRIVFLFGVWKISLPEAYSFYQTRYRARLREKKL